MRHISLVLPALLAVLAPHAAGAQSTTVPTTAPQRASLTDAAGGATNDHYARLFAHLDAGHKGYIAPADVEARAAARFDRLDRQRKGYITLEDWTASLHRSLDRASEDQWPRLERALQRYEAVFKTLDHDGDGKVTKEEFVAGSRVRFAAADTDHDGKITLDELRAARGRLD
jgi:Ca2+-binding EF-hand superfamily protein